MTFPGGRTPSLPAQRHCLPAHWSVEFIKGGPELPPAFTTTELKSWTELGGEAAQRFGGTARYRLEFDAPTATADDWLLDLGDVRESARVRLNGTEIAAWSLPFESASAPHSSPDAMSSNLM